MKTFIIEKEKLVKWKQNCWGWNHLFVWWCVGGDAQSTFLHSQFDSVRSSSRKCNMNFNMNDLARLRPRVISVCLCVNQNPRYVCMEKFWNWWISIDRNCNWITSKSSSSLHNVNWMFHFTEIQVSSRTSTLFLLGCFKLVLNIKMWLGLTAVGLA